MRASTILILIVVFVGALGGIVGMGLYMRANEQARQEITPADQIKPSLAVMMQKDDAAKVAVDAAKPVVATQPVVRIEKVNTELAKPQPVKVVEKPADPPKGEPVSIVAETPPEVQKMGKEIVLLAGDAVMQGRNLRKLPGGEIAGMAAHDSLEWMIEPEQAGIYTLEITYSSSGEAGGVCLISAGPRVITHTVTPTGDWDKFETVSLGKLTLPAKPLRVQVKPTLAREGGVMTVRSVRVAVAKRLN